MKATEQWCKWHLNSQFKCWYKQFITVFIYLIYAPSLLCSHGEIFIRKHPLPANLINRIFFFRQTLKKNRASITQQLFKKNGGKKMEKMRKKPKDSSRSHVVHNPPESHNFPSCASWLIPVCCSQLGPDACVSQDESLFPQTLMSLIFLRCTRTNVIMVNNLWTTLRCPVANLILVFALRICCLHAKATHCFFFFYKPDKVRGFRQTVCHHISLSTHQRTCSHWLSQGASAGAPMLSRWITQVVNYNISFMSTRSTGRTCNSESHQEICNTFKPQRYWAMHQMYEGIWRNCMCEYNHFVPHFMPVEDFYVRIQQRVPRVEREGIRSGKQTSKRLGKSAILFWGMVQHSK